MTAAAPAPDTAHKFWHLVDIYFPIGVVVFVLVVAGLIGVGLRFRSNAEEYPKGADDKMPLELSYLVLVGAVAAYLLYLTFSTMSSEKETIATASGGHPGVPAGALVVRVNAAQWAWRFDYPGGVTVQGDNRHWPTLVVPAGRPVHFTITSVDVVHSFWIVDRRIKVDAFPRRITTANLRWPEPGYWAQGGVCNQFCGHYHTDMNFNVRALPAAAFAAWLAQQPRSTA
jgi:cytochrome c oxidase subunit 2